ncbi:hypothetical protein ACJX0J_030942, partial [Zea mays]
YELRHFSSLLHISSFPFDHISQITNYLSETIHYRLCDQELFYPSVMSCPHVATRNTRFFNFAGNKTLKVVFFLCACQYGITEANEVYQEEEFPTTFTLIPLLFSIEHDELPRMSMVFQIMR